MWLLAVSLCCIPAIMSAGDIRDRFDFTEVGPSDYWPMRKELRGFFPMKSQGDPKDPAVVDHWESVWRELESWAKAHPEADALDIRCESYRIMGRTFLPILFHESPFYFEAGCNGGWCNNAKSVPGRHVNRICSRFYREQNLIPESAFRLQNARQGQSLALCCGPFSDDMHHVPPFRTILKKGFRGVRDEVAAALALLPDCEVTLLHCTTEYPCPYADVNLKALKTLAGRFGLPVGYSDHTPGIEVSIAAAAMGATVIEKHFTLDRTMEGPDHKASLEPNELRDMVAAIRHVTDALTGDGVKKPVEAERAIADVARKSIVARRDIAAGEVFSADNLATMRPGTGISPMQWDAVVGRTASRSFSAGEQISL